MTAFERAFAIVVGHEGGFDATPGDPGNWTGGSVGEGALRGTKYGISAASYPDLAIADLTTAQAAAIYLRDYWTRIHGDELPPALALLVFDAAVNTGVGRATRWLQQAAGTTADGVIGPATLAAVAPAAANPTALCTEFSALRLAFMAALPTWRLFGLGWARRVSALPYQSMTMTEA